MDCKITLIPGDGIGPEIVAEAVKVLNAVADKYGHKFDYTKILMGGCSIDECGVPLTDEAVAIAKASDAVLLGAVGGNVGNSRWYDVAPDLRPEAGLLKIRKDLELFANIRPAYLYNELKAACPLKEEIIGDGFDMVIMRELTGGLYFGKRHTEEVDGLMTAVDTLTYNEEEIRRIAIKGFEIAMKEKKESNKRRQSKRTGFLPSVEIRGRGCCKRLPGSYLRAYAGRQLCDAESSTSVPV